MSSTSAVSSRAADYGAEAVDDAYQRALNAEFIDVELIEHLLTRGAGAQSPPIATPPAASRFVRAATDFSVRRPS